MRFPSGTGKPVLWASRPLFLPWRNTMFKKRVGLGALPPTLRLALVFAASTLFVLIKTLPVALALFGLGLFLFILGEKRNWKLALSSPVSGGFMFVYNLIFSPPGYGGLHWFVFTLNQAGLERGAVTSLRLMGIMFISFAWLAATPIPEMYKSVAWLTPGREWTLGILRGVQILQREFVILTQSLIIRGLKWNSLAANLRNLVPLAVAIIPRVIENAQKATLASVSHRMFPPKGQGQIKAEGVFARYSPDAPEALKNISLTVESGEFVYLAGKNMAGKTTLLRVLGGVVPWVMGEFKGRAEVSGMVTHLTPLSHLAASARFIAPDPFASIHGLTVGQEISFLTKDEMEARKALSVMGIDEFWERETTKLSGGQQVRLVLAGALVSDAKVLLLDSPMQELDPQGRRDFQEAFAILRETKGSTVLVTDQFWRELLPYSDRVLVLEEGELTADVLPNVFSEQGWLARCNLEDLRFPRTPQSLGETVAEMSGVHVSLDGNHILRGVDFSVRQGEFVAVTGPNGSGKTTAMLTLAGAIRPSRGEVRTKASVGYVFQNAALQVLAMTAGEELAFGPKVLKWKEHEIGRFVASGLDWSGLSDSVCPLDLHPQEVRMLAIAACNTDVGTLILDEPTLGLDSQAVDKIANLITSLCSRGKAVVVITHDQALAASADRVVGISDGKVSKEYGYEVKRLEEVSAK